MALRSTTIEKWFIKKGDRISYFIAVPSGLEVSHSPICGKCDILGLIKRLNLTMPKKIRELKQMLVRANFTEIPGKGSHTNWIHPLSAGKLTVSGKDSSDAKRYQEKDVQQAIQEVEEKQRENQEDEQI